MTWMDDAACRGQSRLMWPVEGETDGQRRRRERDALALCAACPVSDRCAAVADEYMHGTGGVMAGKVWRPGRGYQQGRATQSVAVVGVRPTFVECGCGARVNIGPVGPVPRQCPQCRANAAIDARRRFRLKGKELIDCRICGRPMVSRLGIETHLAKAHGIRGVTMYAKRSA